jgi:hypothetical protein
VYGAPNIESGCGMTRLLPLLRVAGLLPVRDLLPLLWIARLLPLLRVGAGGLLRKTGIRTIGHVEPDLCVGVSAQNGLRTSATVHRRSASAHVPVAAVAGPVPAVDGLVTVVLGPTTAGTDGSNGARPCGSSGRPGSSRRGRQQQRREAAGTPHRLRLVHFSSVNRSTPSRATSSGAGKHLPATELVAYAVSLPGCDTFCVTRRARRRPRTPTGVFRPESGRFPATSGDIAPLRPATSTHLAQLRPATYPPGGAPPGRRRPAHHPIARLPDWLPLSTHSPPGTHHLHRTRRSQRTSP